MRRVWSALKDGCGGESLLEEMPDEHAARARPLGSRGPRSRPGRRGRTWLARTGVAAVALALLTCGFALDGAAAAPPGGLGARATGHQSHDPSPLSWTSPQLIDGQYPFADPNSFNSMSCASATLCVGTTSGSGEIIGSTDPTGSSTSDWSVLPTSLLAGDASGYSLAGASCVTAGASPFCLASGSNSINTTDPGLVLTATNPTGGAGAWLTTLFPTILDPRPSCSPSATTPTCITAGNANQSASPPTLYVSTDPGGASFSDWDAITPMAFADNTSVVGVACPTSSFCAALTSNDVFVTSSSPTTSWSMQTSPPDLSFVDSLSCPTESFCVAAGVNDSGVEEVDTGDPLDLSWTSNAQSVLSTYSAVSCSGFDDGGTLCVGPASDGGVAASTTPGSSTAWTDESLPAGSGGASATGCMSSDTLTPLCVSGTGEGNVTNSENVPSLATATWSSPVLGVAGGKSPVSLSTQSCPSASLCVGSDGAGRILTSTNPAEAGPTWSSGIVDPGASISSVDCPSTSLCVAVDDTGNVLDSTNPAGGASTWTMPSPIDPGNFLTALSCPSSSLCVAVDGAGNILTSTNPAGGGSTWGSLSVDPDDSGFTALDCPSSGLCVAIDNDFQVFSTTDPQDGVHATWLGPGPAPIDSLPPLSQLACPSSSLCVATDLKGSLLSSSNPAGGSSTWSAPSPVDPGHGLTALVCASGSLCIAGDSVGNLLTSTNPAGGPSTWSAPTSIDPNGGGIRHLVCPSSSLCVATDSDGNVLTSTNPAGGASTWSAPQSIAPDPGIDSLACPSTMLCVATDENGNVITGTGTPSSPPPPTPSQPAVPSAVAPVALSSSSAAFSGQVNPEGLTTTAYFEYGLDPKYSGSGGPVVYTSTTPVQTVGSDFSLHQVTAMVSDLVPNALYHVRLVATNSDGTATSADQTFMTKEDPPPAPPVLGKSFDASPVSGLVFILLPGGEARDSGHLLAHATFTKGAGYIPLTEARQLPAGTKVDARLGTLKLVSATGIKRKTQTGNFGGAIFKFAQTTRGRGKGLTTLSLLEAAFPGAPTYASCTKGRAADLTGPIAHAAKLSSKVLQTLKASGHGKFRTSGRYGAATVLGTIWTISDHCNGTLIHAIKDTVSVQNLVAHITITLHAGHTYLAKARTGKHT